MIKKLSHEYKIVWLYPTSLRSSQLKERSAYNHYHPKIISRRLFCCCCQVAIESRFGYRFGSTTAAICNRGEYWVELLTEYSSS